MEDLDITDILKLLNLSSENRDSVLSIYSIVLETFRGLVTFLPTTVENYRHHESTSSRDSNLIVTSRRNLMRLIGLLDNYDPKSEQFKRNFLAWEIVRKKNVKCLKDVAKSMQKDHTICNIASISSNTVAALAGIAVVGALIFPPAAPFIVPMMASGVVAAGAGGAASFATSVADFSLLKKHIHNAQKIREEDKSNFQILGDWIAHTEEVKTALSDLIGMDIWMEMWDNFKDFNIERRNLSSSDMVAKVKQCVTVACVGQPLHVTLGINAASVVLTAAIAMMLFHVQTRSVLQLYKLGLGVVRGVEAFVEIGRLASAAGRSGSTLARLVPQTLAKRVAFKTIAGVGVAVDVTMIVLSSIELAKGEMSKEGKDIVLLSEMLEDERKVLRTVYESMD